MKRILRLPFKWLASALAVVALGVSAFFHGLAAVPAAPVDNSAAAGAIIHAGPWDVTIIGGRVIASQDGLTTDTKGDHWFGIVAVVDVTANESHDDMTDIVRLPYVTGLTSAEPKRVMMVRDATDVGYLNPGMPEKIEYLWEQAPNAQIPSSVDVVVYGEKLEPFLLSGGQLTWMDRAPLVTVSVPVVDKRS